MRSQSLSLSLRPDPAMHVGVLAAKRLSTTRCAQLGFADAAMRSVDEQGPPLALDIEVRMHRGPTHCLCFFFFFWLIPLGVRQNIAPFPTPKNKSRPLEQPTSSSTPASPVIPRLPLDHLPTPSHRSTASGTSPRLPAGQLHWRGGSAATMNMSFTGDTFSDFSDLVDGVDEFSHASPRGVAVGAVTSTTKQPTASTASSRQILPPQRRIGGGRGKHKPAAAPVSSMTPAQRFDDAFERLLDFGYDPQLIHMCLSRCDGDYDQAVLLLQQLK